MFLTLPLNLSPQEIIVIILWIVSAAADDSEFCYIWQLKEYRWKRFMDFLSTREGKLYLGRYPMLWRTIAATVIFFWPINQHEIILFLLTLILGADAIHTAIVLMRRQFRHPVFTGKALLIMGASIALEGILIVRSQDWTILLVFLILRFFLFSGVVGLFYFPTELLKRVKISRARKKMSRFPNMKVVGITGSYGKTTTKEFLSHILSKKFTVIKTPHHVNTEIGVAQFILSHSFEGANIFVVEMGAYKKGDIRIICDMVRPTIGILTAINEQHLSLFGSIETTRDTKYELLKSLPKDGLAIVNSDNPYCRSRLAELQCAVETFGAEEAFHPTLFIQDTEEKKEGLRWRGTSKSGDIAIETPLRGLHLAMNTAPCVVAARALNLTDNEIVERCKTLAVPEGALQIYPYGDAVILDDSHNANPDGFKAALQTLATFGDGKTRVVITRGMLELGERSKKIHEAIGEEISFTADVLVLIKRDFEASLRRGLQDKYRLKKIVVYEDPADLLSYLQSLKNTKAAILLENRMPSIISEELKNHL
ncbi:MAG: UDP-N-acetylmuramoyl-tripeptide--D-alanyl-D-alanine ligase [Patescibacteria group bacterium]